MAEPACKPGSVVDSHSSRRIVTDTLKQPTRTRRGPRHEVPIWSCSRWGLPCRSVARLAVRSYRTISPLPDPCHPFAVSRKHLAGFAGSALEMSTRSIGWRQRGDRAIGGIFLLHFPSARAAQALPGTVPCGARTFLGIASDDATVRPTPPARIVSRASVVCRHRGRNRGSIGPVTAPACRPHQRPGQTQRAIHRHSCHRCYGCWCGFSLPPPYSALRGAPVISAASRAAEEGGRCAESSM